MWALHKKWELHSISWLETSLESGISRKRNERTRETDRLEIAHKYYIWYHVKMSKMFKVFKHPNTQVSDGMHNIDSFYNVQGYFMVRISVYADCSLRYSILFHGRRTRPQILCLLSLKDSHSQKLRFTFEHIRCSGISLCGNRSRYSSWAAPTSPLASLYTIRITSSRCFLQSTT